MREVKIELFKMPCNKPGHRKILIPHNCPYKVTQNCKMFHEFDGETEECQNYLFDFVSEKGRFVYCDYEETSVKYIKELGKI